MKKMENLRKAQAFSTARFRIEDDDTMRDVSLLAAGEAQGHGLVIDEDSLQTALSYLGTKKRLRAYLHHAMFEDRLGEEIGYFENPYIDGDRLMAEKFTFLKSFRNNKKDKYEALLELAKEMPEEFGLSLSFSFLTEIKEGDEMPRVRFQEIYSADFVDQPAANPKGLFRIEDNNTKNNTQMADNKDQNTELLELQKKVVALESERDSLKKTVENKEAALKTADAQRAAELKDERERAGHILQLGKDHNMLEVALKAIEDNKSIDEFKADLLEGYRSGSFSTTQEDSFEIDPDAEPKTREEFAATHEHLKGKDAAKATEYFKKHYKKHALR